MEIDVADLAVELDGRRVLDGTNLTVATGERVAIVGANGTGKTTLLRAIVGWCRPLSGRVRFDGDALTSRPRPERDLGVLIGELPAHPGHRVGDHLGRVAALTDAPPGHLDELVARLGVDGYARRRVRTLSTGMGRRAHLVAAFLGRPQAVVLDEPTTGLDGAAVAELGRLLEEAADDGRSAVIVTHEPEALASAIDRVEELRTGRLTGREWSR